jgi:hypothetical protein
MSTTRAGGGVTGSGLASALLLLGGLLAVAAGPELLAWVCVAPGMKLVPYYLLAVLGLLVVGVLLFRGGEGLGSRTRCGKCGASNSGHAKFCDQCAAPISSGMPR